MSQSNQETVYEGWLTKSPPSKRIWRARWRRRWFCLQNSGELPGQYCLTYYTDRKCRKLKGSINLDLCEQVDTGLKLENGKYKFDFMFDIKTPNRTYYLAADTEEEMKEWVKYICNICSLKGTTDDEIGTINSSPVYVDQHNESLHGNTDKSETESPPISPVSTGPYIPISECITGRRPSQGVQDFHSLLQHNIKNSYFRSLKDHNNQMYDTSPPTYLNDVIKDDPRFYDCPRSLQLPHSFKYKDNDLYNNTIKLEKNYNCSPLQSPTDSESVFTDDDWPNHNLSDSIGSKNANTSNSLMADQLITEALCKTTLEDMTKILDPPPRPPKPNINYLNILPTSTNKTKIIKENDNNLQTDITNTDVLNSIRGISDEMYDFPRSHQIETSESLPCTLLRRHCYNNAAPVKIEGQIFRYDISPKPSTSSVQEFQFDNFEIQDEPASPLSQGSSTTTAMYSNLPSPLLSSDTQLMPPPQINRNLKPKRKLSDSLSVASNTEPSSPRPAPTVDRSCKPAINSQTSGLRKAFESEAECNRWPRGAPSPLPLIDHLYGNQQTTILRRVQYLDLDHSTSQYGTTTSKSQPLRSPGATTVYKQVDFMKTQAFNNIRLDLEMQRKEPVTSFKK